MKLLGLITIAVTLVAALASSENNDTKEFIVLSNEKVEFKCLGQGISWSLPSNGQVLRQKVTRFNDRTTLTIENVNAHDIGIYKCIYPNRKETKFILGIYYGLNIKVHANPTNVREHDDITLNCKTSGVPKAESVNWMFDNKILVHDNVNVDIRNDGSEIILKNMTLDRAGEYTCFAIQKYKTLTNKIHESVIVNVEYSPKPFTNISQKVKGVRGKKVEILCHVDTSSIAYFIWMKNHRQIYENVFNTNSESRLTVDLSSDENFGNYTCSAYNGNGELKQNFEVIEIEEEEEEFISTTEIIETQEEISETSGKLQTKLPSALMMMIFAIKFLF